MKRRDVIVSGALAIGAGAALGQSAVKPAADPLKGLKRQRDDMKGITFYQSPSSPKFRNAHGFYLYFGKSDNGAMTPLRLVAQYYADSWLFVEKLLVKVDSAPAMEVPGLSDRRAWERDNDGGKIWEWADVPLQGAAAIGLIRRVAGAKSAALRYEGRQYYNDRKLSAQQLKAMQDVISAYEAVSGKPWM